MTIVPPMRRSRSPHADQPQSGLAIKQSRIETDSIIDNGKVQCLDTAPQLHRCPLGAAVLDHILQAFLGNAIKAQGRFLRKPFRHLAEGELDLQAVGRVNSWHRPRTVATSPSCSSFDGCSRCDSSCTEEDNSLTRANNFCIRPWNWAADSGGF